MTFVDDAGLKRLVALAAEPELIADRFELGGLLGEGGMGSVYEAWDREGQRSVALKLLRNLDEPLDAATSVRFEREAQALAALSHPSIVGYIAHGRTGADERYLVMERLTGVTLAARLAAGPLGVLDAVRVAHGVATALAAAHALALVHRDIKPSNVFLEGGDPQRVKLLDFGLARGKEALAVTHAGALLGTPGYMAPEQARGASAPDARSDLFALGAVLFECLTGRAPFTGADTEAVLVKILVERPPRVSELRPGLPALLDALVVRLLAKEPAHRPADAAEVAAELAAVLAGADTDTAPGDAEREPHATRPGALIAGKYRVLRALGSGGMGVVLLAHHETLDRNVAIKLLRGRDDAHADGRVARLVREARAVSRLESEHVARVMDVGTLDDGAPFIVMEYLSGHDLAQVLRERKRLPVSEVVDYVLQACRALAEAHALGIVHRDLKPSNLFLTTRRDGSALVKVLDFGISKLSPPGGDAAEDLHPGEASITAPGAILGSPLYMSPEQLQSPRRVDARTDLWSLGVVLHELLSGRSPFDADSFIAIAARIAAVAPADVRDGCPEAPESLARVVRRCLEKDPAQRFQSIDELTQALAPHAASARTSAEPRDSEPAPGGRRRALLVTLGVASAFGAALFVLRRAPVTTSPAPPQTTPASITAAASVAPPGEPVPATPSASTAALPATPPPSASPAPASEARPARSAPAAQGKRRTTPAAGKGAAAPAATQPPMIEPTDNEPAPIDPSDPMNPALLSR